MSIKPVIEAMEQLYGIHDELLGWSERKTEALVKNQVEELNRIVHKEAGLVRQLTEWENNRQGAVDRFLISKGFRPDPRITIHEVIKLLFHVEDKHTLMALQQQLSDKVNNLRLLNEHNKQLIEQSLAFIDYSVELMAGHSEDNAWYENPMNQKSGPAKAIRFDTRA